MISLPNNQACVAQWRTGAVFTNHFSECSLSYSPEFSVALEAFECKTTSDWLNHMVSPIRSCVTFKFTNLGEKDKEHP